MTRVITVKTDQGPVEYNAMVWFRGAYRENPGNMPWFRRTVFLCDLRSGIVLPTTFTRELCPQNMILVLAGTAGTITIAVLGTLPGSNVLRNTFRPCTL